MVNPALAASVKMVRKSARLGVKPLNRRQKVQVKRLIKQTQESKYFILQSTNTFDYSGAVVKLSAIPQGDTDVTRDGDKITPTSLSVRYSIYNTGTAATSPTEIDYRVIIFRWRPDDTSGAPIASNIMATTGNLYAALSEYIHDQRSNFEVLYDRMHLGVLSVLGAGANRPFHAKVKVNSRSIKYLAGGTAGLDNLYILFITDNNGVAGANKFTYVMNSQLNFTDS